MKSNSTASRLSTTTFLTSWLFVAYVLVAADPETPNLSKIHPVPPIESSSSVPGRTTAPTAPPVLLCGLNRFEFPAATPFETRSYLVYIPSAVCRSNDSVFPALVAIHCYGCMEDGELYKWRGEADRLGFVAITPRGIGSSWNGRQCCGDAMAQKLNDTGFVSSVVRDVEQRMNRTLWTYVTGFSNGGFLASILALEPWVHGVAPTAGHHYDPFTLRTPKPLFLHHSRTDTYVQFDGCCEHQCCCDIDYPSCVSIDAIFNRWLASNRCNGQPVTMLSIPDKMKCISGVRCAANTTMCIHKDTHHTAWSEVFPAARLVADFFALDACLQHGQWSQKQQRCACKRGFYGRYCLQRTPPSASHRNRIMFGPSKPMLTDLQKDVSHHVPFMVVLAKVILFAVICGVLVVCISKLTRL